MRVTRAWIRALTTGVALACAVTVALPSRAEPVAQSQNANYVNIPIQETGRVDRILDGDTFRFVEDGTSNWVKIRLLGVNTPEVTGFNNIHFDEDMCGAQEALRLLDSLIPAGTRVQLRSDSKASSNRGRFLRYVFALNPKTGKYDIDVQAVIAESGLAQWFTIDEESALSYPYRLIIQRAQRGGRGIWDPFHCGPIEQPDAKIDLTVSWDAPGTDTTNLNGEFVIVRNVGTSTVDLSGWLLRDSSLTAWFHFPSGTVLTPGEYRVVHVGSGRPGVPDPRDLYMDAVAPLFPNTQDGKFVGDGAYLLDRKTAVRFYDEYPCILDCTDPLTGQVRIVKVNPRSKSVLPARAANEEYVVIKNVSAAPALLDGYYLRRKVSTYPFPPNTVILPGQPITVRIGKGATTSDIFYWGRSAPLLTNRHDRVEMLSNQNVVVSAKRW